MNNKDTRILIMRPYARLMTMLGEQLIKNDKIAIIELIKNSYDADASWVQVRYCNFKEINEDVLETSDNSYIEIEDDGGGMTFEVIENAWMNPATPIKYLQKKIKKKTKKGRVIQGEKGIGRFAAFKIGASVQIVSRSTENSDSEIIVSSDFSMYDSDFLEEDRKKKDIFLDQLTAECKIIRPPQEIVEKDIVVRNVKRKRLPQGTIIRLSNLRKHNWSKDEIDDITEDILRLESPFQPKGKEDFIVEIVINGKSLYKADEIKEKLTGYFNRAPIVVKNGRYNDKENTIIFNVNNIKKTLEIDRLRAIKEFRDRFCNGNTEKIIRYPNCGPFGFEFYIFDLSSQAPPKYILSNEDKKTIRKHRVYLYRDNIRVYPYGDPDDDWLGVGVLRGTGRAGDYLSMDQTFGNITITYEHNPKLKDKTNREGLLEIDGAFGDFKVLIQGILGYLHKEFRKYKTSLDRLDKQKLLREGTVENLLNSFTDHLTNMGDTKGVGTVKGIIRKYIVERNYLKDRAEISEDLAAVGLSVEMTSHDMMVMMGRAKDTVDTCMRMTDTDDPDIAELNEELQKLRGLVTFVEDQLHVIQPLFRSSKRPIRRQRVGKVINDIQKYFGSALVKGKIKVEVEESTSPLIVKCMNAVLLQTFINLFDNAIYWLSTVDIKDKTIRILINGDVGEVIFADNGPGVWEDDIPHIFNPFFSTKGLEGRGLGLYIARQLLERSDFKIDYLTEKPRRILSGANFLISFVPDGGG